MVVGGSGAKVDIVKLKIGLVPRQHNHRFRDHKLLYLPLQTRRVERWRACPGRRLASEDKQCRGLSCSWRASRQIICRIRLQGKAVENASNRLGHSKPGRFSLLIGLRHRSHCIPTPIVGHRRCTHQDKHSDSAQAKTRNFGCSVAFGQG